MLKNFLLAFFIILSFIKVDSALAQTPQPAYTEQEIETLRLKYEQTKNIKSFAQFLNIVNRDIENLSNKKNQTPEDVRKKDLLTIIQTNLQDEYNDLQNRKGDIAFGFFQVLNSAGITDNPFYAFPRSLFREEAQFTPPKYLRRGVSWDSVQVEENGQIVTKQSVFNEMDRFIDSGFSLLLNIRANARWAVKNPKTSPSSGYCSGELKDMTTEWNNSYGYSKSYYDFISIIAEKYKGKLSEVTIENEMNAAGQTWCAGSSPEIYRRVLLTAQKAFRDHDSKVLVSDGGLTGNVWFWLMLEDKYQKAVKISGAAQKKAEFDLIAKLSSQQIGKNMTIGQTARYFGFLKRTRVVDGKTVYNAPAYMLGLEYVKLAESSNYSRAVNFHYYGHSDSLPYVVAYMRSRLGNKAILNNEIGIQFKDADNFSEEELAGEMVKKFAILRGTNVSHPNWYSSPRWTIETGGGVGIYHKGSFLSPDDYVSPRLKMIKAANMIQKYMDRPTLSRDRSLTAKYSKYIFTDTNETVSVIWGDTEYPFGGDCYVYDSFGQVLYNASGQNLTTKNIQLSRSIPYFEVCGKKLALAPTIPLIYTITSFMPAFSLFGFR